MLRRLGWAAFRAMRGEETALRIPNGPPPPVRDAEDSRYPYPAVNSHLIPHPPPPLTNLLCGFLARGPFQTQGAVYIAHILREAPTEKQYAQ